jgi:hypothetical protein
LINQLDSVFIIGERFDDTNVINIGLSVRQKDDCFSVWISNCSQETKDRVSLNFNHLSIKRKKID